MLYYVNGRQHICTRHRDKKCFYILAVSARAWQSVWEEGIIYRLFYRRLIYPMKIRGYISTASLIKVHVPIQSHPDVVEAGKAALDKYGAGLSSVRFICGTQTIHKVSCSCRRNTLKMIFSLNIRIPFGTTYERLKEWQRQLRVQASQALDVNSSHTYAVCVWTYRARCAKLTKYLRFWQSGEVPNYLLNGYEKNYDISQVFVHLVSWNIWSVLIEFSFKWRYVT